MSAISGRRWPRSRRPGPADPEPLELVAEELRLAADSLGRIVGAIAPDEVLGAIFARFCIGK